MLLFEQSGERGLVLGLAKLLPFFCVRHGAGGGHGTDFGARGGFDRRRHIEFAVVCLPSHGFIIAQSAGKL